MHLCPAAEDSQPAGTAAVVDMQLGYSNAAVQDWALRARIRPESPGVLSLAVCSHSSSSSSPAQPPELHAFAPVLVAPNAAVQAEMNAVFTAMQEVVQQQLRFGGETERMDPEQLQDIASKLTWSGHYQVLLWDIKSLQDATAGRSGCLPAHAAAGLLLGVLEFLGHHGCWSTISWLLASAVAANLHTHAMAAAEQRLQETQPLAWAGGPAAAAATCARFVLNLAGSPGRVKPSGGQASPVGISRSRRILSTIGAAGRGLSGLGVTAAAAKPSCSSDSGSSSYHSAVSHCAEGYGSSRCSLDSIPPQEACPGSWRNSPCSTKQGSTASAGYSSFASLPLQLDGDGRAWGRGRWHPGLKLLLVLAAFAVVILLLVLGLPNRYKGALSAAVPQQEQGCMLFSQLLHSSNCTWWLVVQQQACDLLGVLVYVPLMALLALAVVTASEVCLVL